MSDEIRAWVNGRPANEGPALEAIDHGVTVGDGVFETAKVVDGRPFALTRHHDRMDRSLAGLGLPPLERDRMDASIRGVLGEGPSISFGRLRYTVTTGPGPMGSDRLDGPMTYIVMAGEVPRPEPTTAVAVVPWTRNERAATVGLKTTSYADNVVALAAAKALGATEALFGNTVGDLCEGTGSNVFVVVDGVVYTPPLSSGPLAGITRALTIEWSREDGIEVREERLPLSVLSECDEVFITSSTRDVQAVHAVRVVGEVTTAVGVLPAPDVVGRELPAPGPVTERIAQLFAKRSEEQVDP